MDAYRVLLVALCLTVLGVSQEVGASTLAVAGDHMPSSKPMPSGFTPAPTSTGTGSSSWDTWRRRR
jgi:hypothetical protein